MAFKGLKRVRKICPNYVMFAYLNITSIRNKFHNHNSFLNNYIDILSIGESKLDESFPSSQFILPGY